MLGFGPRKGKRRSQKTIAIDRALARMAPVGVQLGRLLLVLLVCAAGLWGLQAAGRQVAETHACTQKTRFRFEGASDWLSAHLGQRLSQLAQTPWIDEQLCRKVYEHLCSDGWIRRVVRVSKDTPGIVRISCIYRQPVALAQYGEYFYMVDEYGVRLPGRYSSDPGWLIIQGVREPPPAAGTVWPGKDVAAGSQLADMILREPYNGQVLAILVHNYAGRQDPYSSHLQLLTDRNASRIVWGSAPGEELEENSAEQKLGILRENYLKYGRIDAFQERIDISVFPDRFLVPT